MQRGIVSLRPLERTAMNPLYDTADSGPGIIGAEPSVAYAGTRNDRVSMYITTFL